MSDKQLSHFIAIIRAMTPKERAHPEILNNSRKRRIALGSGTSMAEVNLLLKQFNTFKSFMKKLRRNPSFMKALMKGLGGK